MKALMKKLVANKKAALAALLVIAAPTAVMAGSSGDEFIVIWDTLNGWVTGYMGKIVALAMIIVGVVAGIARQSLMSFAIGISAGMGVYNAPTIIENIVTATLG